MSLLVLLIHVCASIRVFFSFLYESLLYFRYISVFQEDRNVLFFVFYCFREYLSKRNIYSFKWFRIYLCIVLTVPGPPKNSAVYSVGVFFLKKKNPAGVEAFSYR